MSFDMSFDMSSDTSCRYVLLYAMLYVIGYVMLNTITICNGIPPQKHLADVSSLYTILYVI